MTAPHERAFAMIVGTAEGDQWDGNPNDRGNWTTGIIGQGELKGSKFGISAASYPKLDIKNLTYADALAIFKRDHWDHVNGDSLPPPLAYLLADAHYNGGQPARWLQLAVGAFPDGKIGTGTLKAVADKVARDGGEAVMVEFSAEHLAYLTSLPTWTTFGADRGNPKGWDRRAFQSVFNALRMGMT